MRKRLAAIDRATTFVDSRRRKALVADLEAQRQAITGPIATADPAQAFALLERFLELAVAAGLAPEPLAEQVADLIGSNGFGQFDELIPTLSDALGPEGLRWLQRHFEEIGGPDASYALRQIAEGLGDVDAYLELFDERQLRWPDTAADAALHLLEAGRAEQALAVLERARETAARIEAQAWDDARIAVLDALCRGEEAQQHRWQCFCRTLSIPRLREYLRRLDDFEDVEAEEKALQVAEAHPQPLRALHFLAGWPALPCAARHVIGHWQDWDGDAYEIYGPAAGHLRTCELLAARIDDWQGVEPHTSFAGRLREAFGMKWSFWKLVER